MGYSTEFTGEIKISPPLSDEQITYINTFSSTRRMARNESILASMPDPVRDAVGLPVGQQGEFYVGSTSDFGQTRDKSIIDFNLPPKSQPGLWCDWEVSDDGKYLEWNGSEKFYGYVEWLEYMNKNFFTPWKKDLNGEIKWEGDDSSDRGVIVVINNNVKAFEEDEYKKYLQIKKDKKALENELKVNINSKTMQKNKQHKI